MNRQKFIPRINHSLSIFFPCYNDSQSIADLVRTADKIARSLTKDYEIIVVNDGSTDNSLEVLQKLTNKYSHLKLIIHKKNQGYGGALASGFKAASKDLVFYTDGDGQYDVNELPLLLSQFQEDTNFVNGIKLNRHDPAYRVLLGDFYNFIVRLLFWIPIYDTDCDFRLIKTSLVKKIKLYHKSGAICVELVKKCQIAGGVFSQVTVNHYERRFGRSQFFKPERLISTFIELAKLRWELISYKA